MKSIILIFLAILLVFVVIYILVGPLPLFLSKFHGDYPGPKQLNSNAVKPQQPVDWLLLHGASLDARVWTGVLKRNPQIPMTALSLSQHEDGVKYADPGHQAALDIIDYLRYHDIKKGVVGHSTASLWLADAYSRCPECFKGLQIILLAPSTGSNIKSSDIDVLKTLHKFSYIIPDPFLGGAVGACQGVDDNSYRQCKKEYLYGRLLYVNSVKYYTKLVSYSLNQDIIKNLEYFLEQDRQNITVYLAANDQVLIPAKTEEFLQQYKIPYHVIPNAAHHMLLEQDKIWLPQN